MAASISTLKSKLSLGLGMEVLEIEPISGGGNNRLYRIVVNDGQCYAVKVYWCDARDRRNRVATEFDSLTFMWNRGFRCIPAPVFCDGTSGFAVYEYVQGEKLDGQHVETQDIGHVVHFLARLKEASRSEEARSLMAASDACFSVADVVTSVRQRLVRLRDVSNDGIRGRQLAMFLSQELEPFFAQAVVEAAALLKCTEFSLDAVLSPAERTLSPSDYGFHNALRRDDGSLVFVDFEYFGWDDPAKMVVDFILHPAMRLSADQKWYFLENMTEVFGETLRDRVRFVYPLHGVAWCARLLGEFVPECASRREFAFRGADHECPEPLVQLQKAREKLDQIMRDYLEIVQLKTAIKNVPRGLDRRSRDLRRTILRTVDKGRRGHIASAFSIVEILRVLYDHILRYDSKRPEWPGRDRFILSKGHGCLALYVLLAEKGFFPERELDLFCTMKGILGGHPERRIPGVEVSTGSLGHGLSIGIGFALNARLEKRDSRVFVVVGDGELGEGSVWEAAMSAAKHGLDNLTVLVDHNNLQSYGSTQAVTNLDPLAAKWTSFGFHAVEVDGHDVEALERVLRGCPLAPGKPTTVICHTVKGKGIERMENNLAWHHKSKISDQEISWLMSELG